MFENLKKRDNLQDIYVHGMIILKLFIEKFGMTIRTDFNCFKIGTSGKLFRIR